MLPFVGRKRELESLVSLFNKSTASLVVVKGRRRIGKSRLIQELGAGHHFLSFSGIPPVEGVTAQTQRDVFTQKLAQELGISNLQLTDWADIFTLLARGVSKRKTVILLDEISWMGSKDPSFLGKLKNAWDVEFQKNAQLILVLCGSVSTWITENIINSTGFFGRISLYITLEELSLSESKDLLAQKKFRGSSYDLFKILSITGGVPWYLEQIQPKLSADANIKKHCFSPEGIFVNEFDRIFHDIFENRTTLYLTLVNTLADGPKSYEELSQGLNYTSSGALSRYLDDLIETGFISRDFTWDLKKGKKSRLSHYRLADNYLRFYLKYISPRKEDIREDRLQDLELRNLKGWSTIMGLQFENLVLKNRKKIWERLKISPGDIVCDGPFFQRATTIQPGCQIDYMIQTRFNTVFVCEVKFSVNEISSRIIPEMKDKFSRLKMPKQFSFWPVLIHVGGISDALKDEEFFTEIIDFSDFLISG